MEKVTILALHLGYGGIEKSAITLANTLINNYDVTIVSAYEIYKKPIFEIDRNVKIIYLKKGLKPNKKEINESLKKHRYFKFIKELLKGKNILKEKKKLMIDYIKNMDSDIIIATRSEYSVWLSKYGNKNSIKIGWEHDYINNKKVLDSFNKLNYLVLISKEQCEYYKNMCDNTVYIPNILDTNPNKLSKLDEKNIISIGKLSKEKGYDDLIDVFKLVNNKYPDWKLNIVGGGKEYNNLKNRIDKENLNIELHGFLEQEELDELYLKSSICVSTAYKEISNIVLLEAFSYGIPCIAFDRSIGAKELISDNWDGYLVKYSDKEKMTRRIIELIENSNRRFVMGRNGSKKAAKYNMKEIKKEWIKLFKR